MAKRDLMGVSSRDRNSPQEAKPVDLSDGTVLKFVGDNSLVLVDCWAPWCGPCRMVAPTIDQIARDYSGRVAVGKLNVDDNPQTSIQYEIMSIPTLLVFKKGRLVDKIVGAVPKSHLEKRLQIQISES